MVSVLTGVDMGCGLPVLFSSSCWSNHLNHSFQRVVSLSLEGPFFTRNDLVDLASLNMNEQLERLKSILTPRF